MTDNVEFQNAIPSEFLIDPPVSSSKTIQRKTLKEFLPTENTTYTPDSNSVIRFNIASNDSFLDGKNSYFKCQFTYDTDIPLTSPPIYMFERGGMSALFKNVEVYSQLSGTLLERIENFNLYNALKLVATSSSAIEESNLTDRSYMDFQNMTEHNISARGWTKVPGVVNTRGAVVDDVKMAVFETSGRTVTLTSGPDLQTSDILCVGDSVMMNGMVCEVNSITSSTTFTVIGYKMQLESTNVISSPLYVKRTRLPSQTLARYDTELSLEAYQGGTINMVWQLNLSVLNLFLPLFLMKGGIQLRFELDSPFKSFYTVNNSMANLLTTPSVLQYSIKYPRYMGMLVTPHGDVIEEFVQQFESPMGLIYYLPCVKTRKLNSNRDESSTTLQSNVGVRSARRLLCVVVDSALQESSTSVTRANRSLSQYLKSYITSFQVKVGGVEYPLRKVDTSDEREWLQHLKTVFKGHGTLLSPEDVRAPGQGLIIDTNGAVKNDPCLIMAVNLSRDDGEFGYLTGVDLSLVPIDLDITRENKYSDLVPSPAVVTSFPGSPQYYLFVEYDAYMRIGSDQISILS